MIAENDDWLVRGIVAIYHKQTADEQNSESTIENNGVGFNGCDAEFLSSLAKQAIERNFALSQRQIEYGRKKMMKYVGQLTRIANGEL